MNLLSTSLALIVTKNLTGEEYYIYATTRGQKNADYLAEMVENVYKETKDTIFIITRDIEDAISAEKP